VVEGALSTCGVVSQNHSQTKRLEAMPGRILGITDKSKGRAVDSRRSRSPRYRSPTRVSPFLVRLLLLYPTAQKLIKVGSPGIERDGWVLRLTKREERFVPVQQ